MVLKPGFFSDYLINKLALIRILIPFFKFFIFKNSIYD